AALGAGLESALDAGSMGRGRLPAGDLAPCLGRGLRRLAARRQEPPELVSAVAGAELGRAALRAAGDRDRARLDVGHRPVRNVARHGTVLAGVAQREPAGPPGLP